MLEFHAAKAGARQAHVLPVTSLHCRRAKSAGTGAVPGGDGGQAGIVPGHQEEAMGVFGTASLPSGQTICSPGCECCELARGQSGAAVWPLCPLSHGGSCVQHSQGHSPGAALGWLCRCPAHAEILLCLPWDAGGCCQSSVSPCAALQGRVHAVGRAPQSLPGFGNRPDQFPRALASGTDLTVACQPHAALSFGLKLPARLDYPWPKHPLVVGALLPAPAMLPCTGNKHESCPSPEQAGQGEQISWLNVSGCIGQIWSCPKEALPMRQSFFPFKTQPQVPWEVS